MRYNMKLIIQLFLVFLMVIMPFSCEKNEADSTIVNAETVIHTALYEELDNSVPIKEVKIIGDELHVTITDGGCNGSRWKAKLIDSGKLTYSNPPQRFAKIEFMNNEECEALITRTFVFNLKPLRAQGSRKVNINLDGWPKQLSYAY